MKTVLSVEGMSCDNCVRHVTKALQKVGGVENVQVDLARKQAEVEGGAAPDDLVAAVVDAGYQASLKP